LGRSSLAFGCWVKGKPFCFTLINNHDEAGISWIGGAAQFYPTSFILQVFLS
jgi:hypothetical protein